ncbi:preprotein translocase subunit SecG [Candidatus Gottesmanbacteria bacterium]|nr:preprotein translocase subunit SecG [Candidatus Gottesmanbacteria bacterium]
MKNIILIFQIAVSVSLILLIILQAKGVGLGRAFGGGGEFYKSRRGVEKIVFNLTIALVIIFLITSILSLIYS